jgi:hypothetical protein
MSGDIVSLEIPTATLAIYRHSSSQVQTRPRCVVRSANPWEAVPEVRRLSSDRNRRAAQRGSNEERADGEASAVKQRPPARQRESIINASTSKRSTTRNTQLDDIDEELRERGQQAAENAHRRDDHGQEKAKAAAARRCVLEQERRNEVPMQSRCGNLWRGSQSGEMPR